MRGAALGCCVGFGGGRRMDVRARRERVSVRLVEFAIVSVCVAGVDCLFLLRCGVEPAKQTFLWSGGVSRWRENRSQRWDPQCSGPAAATRQGQVR